MPDSPDKTYEAPSVEQVDAADDPAIVCAMVQSGPSEN